METLKKYWKKIVLGGSGLVAGLALAYLIFVKYINGEHHDFFESQTDAIRAAREKQRQEEERLRKEKEEAEAKAREQEEARQKETEAKAEEERKRLKKLQQDDPQGFENEVKQQLGVKPKKKGRPKKNE